MKMCLGSLPQFIYVDTTKRVTIITYIDALDTNLDSRQNQDEYSYFFATQTTLLNHPRFSTT